ncbi:MAG: WYL domain-containing protein, partial [Candidatus Omnitrophica bacterium]|nr:WYL domain-containing protein [Candidatus Omnitrophota bacterium]
MSILNKLDRGEMVSTRGLADEFGVTPRTIQRDIGLLGMAGFLLDSPEKGLHSFAEGFSLKKMKLTNEEASLLSFLCEIAQSLGPKFKDSFKAILNKVLQQEFDSPFYAKIPEGVKLDKSTAFIEELESAIEESNKIEIVYLTLEGEEKNFTLDPLKIAFYEGFWYLVARVSGKDWILKLRLERIKKLEVLGENFDVPENLQAMLEQSVNIWFSEKRDKNVRLRIDKDVAHFFRQKTYFPLQKIKRQNRDGSLIVECKASQYDEVANTIKHWIPYIKVIEPKELKEEL